MRAIVVTRHGGPEVLELQDRPAPEPGPGELLVDVEAAGVNFRDIYERKGGGSYEAETPHLAGVEGAGTVAAVGEGISRFAPATASRGATRQGSYAEQVVVRRRRGRAGARRHRDRHRRRGDAPGLDRALPRDEHLPHPAAATRCSSTPPPAGSGCC